MMTYLYIFGPNRGPKNKSLGEMWWKMSTLGRVNYNCTGIYIAGAHSLGQYWKNHKSCRTGFWHVIGMYYRQNQYDRRNGMADRNYRGNHHQTTVANLQNRKMEVAGSRKTTRVVGARVELGAGK